MLFLAAAAVVACIDWWSVRSSRPKIELFAKPLVMVALLAAATQINADPASVKWLIAAGLAGGLVGDIALLPRFDAFIVGLAAFLVGHLFYVVAFVSVGLEPVALLLGLAVAAALTFVLGRPIIAAVAGSRLRVPVLCYVAVIGAMLISGIGTGLAFVGVGALAFGLSDSLLGTDRFVELRDDRRMWVHVLYHVAQMLIVAALL